MSTRAILWLGGAFVMSLWAGFWYMAATMYGGQ